MSEEQGQGLSSELLRQFVPAHQRYEARAAKESQRLAEAAKLKAEMQCARDEFDHLLEGLTELLKQVPHCELHHGPRRREWRLNDAVLRVATPQPTSGHPGELMHSSIAIKCEGDGYREWSHSLWYNRSKRQWQEIGFTHSLAGLEAHFALAPATRYNADPGVYWGNPFPVDADKFIEKWLGWLADAAGGYLRPRLDE